MDDSGQGRTKPLKASQLRQLQKAQFVTAFAESGNVSAACRVADIDRSTYYYWLEHDALFAARVAQAQEQANDALELEARRRAIEGWEEPVWSATKGKQIGMVRKFSDTLLIFLLKGARPGKYRERVDITLDIDATIRRMAEARGLDPDQLVAQAEALLASGKTD